MFESICAWENLELAARLCRRRKRYRQYAEDFELRRETVLGKIRGELLASEWRPSPYRVFTIFDPKERLIGAPCYRDRIVHHALCNVIGPIFERSMIEHSYSCRMEKGTGAARARCKWLAARRKYVLKMDVRRYFPSIDHILLKEKARRMIKCGMTLDLVDRIIDSWRAEDEAPDWFAGDDLMTPAERRRGLPIGALTSQLFANLYLSRIDHLTQEQIKPQGYIRYTDDMLLFDDDKDKLHDARERLVGELAKERLKGHPGKCRVHACRDGIPFLGFRFFPNRLRVSRGNRLRFERRMREMRRKFRDGSVGFEEIWPSMFGWLQFIREFPVNEGLVQAECRAHVFW